MSPDVAQLPIGRDWLRSLKSSAGHPGSPACLFVGNPPIATLRVVATQPDRLASDDVACLTKWRNRFVTSFLTEFVATDVQTGRWLTDVVGPDDTKLLFMADGLDGRTFGYLGIAFIDWERGYGEADAVVRGGHATPGTMGTALRTLMAWARSELGLAEIGVRVRSDNPALGFYRKLGFVEKSRTPLRKTVTGDKTIWTEAPGLETPSPSLVHLRWPVRSVPIPK